VALKKPYVVAAFSGFFFQLTSTGVGGPSQKTPDFKKIACISK